MKRLEKTWLPAPTITILAILNPLIFKMESIIA